MDIPLVSLCQQPQPVAAEPARSSLSVMHSVLFALFLRELKTRLDGRWRSTLWVIGEPLVTGAAVLALYMAARAHTLGGVDTLMFLVTGQLPFLLFRSLVLRLMDAIDANQGLFAYRQVRPIDAVLARAMVEGLLCLGITVVSAIVLLWMGHTVLPRWPIELLLTSAVIYVLGCAVGLLAAVVTSGAWVWARALIKMGFFVVYLSSGAVMSLSALPLVIQEFLLLNPMTHLIDIGRSAFFGDGYRAISGVNLSYPIGLALVVSVLALSLYRVKRDRLQPL